MIEANVKFMTTDKYLLRIFCIGFTKRHEKTEENLLCQRLTSVSATIDSALIFSGNNVLNPEQSF